MDIQINDGGLFQYLEKLDPKLDIYAAWHGYLDSIVPGKPLPSLPEEIEMVVTPEMYILRRMSKTDLEQLLNYKHTYFDGMIPYENDMLRCINTEIFSRIVVPYNIFIALQISNERNEPHSISMINLLYGKLYNLLKQNKPMEQEVAVENKPVEPPVVPPVEPNKLPTRARATKKLPNPKKPTVRKGKKTNV
jgi:hypothetical protein